MATVGMHQAAQGSLRPVLLVAAYGHIKHHRFLETFVRPHKPQEARPMKS